MAARAQPGARIASHLPCPGPVGSKGDPPRKPEMGLLAPQGPALAAAKAVRALSMAGR